MGRPPGPTLNQMKVVQTARHLAEMGVSNLSMTVLAERLGVTPMALYRHVRDKRNLIALVLDDVLSEIAVPGPDRGDWAQRLRLFHRGIVEALARLPGITEFFGEMPRAPNSSRLLAGYIEILLDSGITERQAILAYTTLYYLAIGSLFGDTRSRPQASSPAANPSSYPSATLDRIRGQAATMATAELREYGVEAVIRLVTDQAAPRGRRPRR
jgi:AcrR family transcriptional regulator